MEKPQERHTVDKVLNKTPRMPKIRSEQLFLEDDREPEILLYPPPPKENTCDPYKLANYYERHIQKAIITKERLTPIYERLIEAYPTVSKWIKYAKFQECLGFPHSTRSVLVRAGEFYGGQGLPQELLDTLIKFEERQIKFNEIYEAYTVLGKKYGSRKDRSDMEEAVFWKIKFEYACRIQYRPAQHDVWLKYIEILKSEGSFSYEDIRSVYQEATSQGPSLLLKRHWVNYIRLWIDYASLEKEANNFQRCREVYADCIDHIPHNRFTFSQLWLLYVEFEIGQGNLILARDILRNAVDICSGEIIDRPGIDRDDQIIELNSCKKIFDILLDLEPEDDAMWRRYDDWKNSVGYIDENEICFEKCQLFSC